MNISMTLFTLSRLELIFLPAEGKEPCQYILDDMDENISVLLGRSTL